MGVDLLPDIERNKPWQPEKWSPRHKLIVAMHLSGDKNKEICRKLKVTPGHVSVVLNDPRAIYEIEQLAGTVADRALDTGIRIKLYANEALDEIIEELRTSRSEKVRQTAAFGLLDRAGYTPVRETREETPPMLPEDVVHRMEETTRELMEYSGIYREVKPKEVEDTPEDAPFAPGLGEPRGEGEPE